MKRILLAGLLVLIFFVLATSPVVKRWTGSYLAPISTPLNTATAPSASPIQPVSRVKCDGRKYCSQMTSCAEATAFLQRCPGTEMDGDGDGVPCESQWCR
ncbi:excalibur calcium-binding domain-containing protein [Xanthomonas sp. WHRI 1810A]|uniref:excalibur calcium-binding domain-containing protein n=1 Tax=Xanthomonas sp. WHRI 1810A TaxID=3161565 RepID=UPI0032E8FF55